VVVGRDEDLFSVGMRVETSAFEDAEDFIDQNLTVKIRSRSAFLPVKIRRTDDESLIAEFETAQRAVTPGQFAVFYKGRRVVGGGAILEALAEIPSEQEFKKAG
jgi:tRNA-specific 2-thiouridylase